GSFPKIFGAPFEHHSLMVDPADQIRESSAHVRANELQTWVLFQHPGQNQPCKRDGCIEHEPQPGGHVVALSRLKRHREGRMKQDWYPAPFGSGKQRPEALLVRETSVQIGIEQNALHSKLARGTLEFRQHRIGTVEWKHRQSKKARRI